MMAGCLGWWIPNRSDVRGPEHDRIAGKFFDEEESMMKREETVHEGGHGGTALIWMLAGAHVLFAWMTSTVLWPLLGNHPNAAELVLTTFGISAVLCAGVGLSVGNQSVLGWLGFAWAAGFFALSVPLEEHLSGAAAGIAMRVGALSTIAFGAAALMISRKKNRSQV
jgi:hypothetical protein